MRTYMQRGLLAVVVLATIALMTSCGASAGATYSGSNLTNVAISIYPTSVSMNTSTVQPFTATVTNTTMVSVTWLINGLVGGAEQDGSFPFGQIDSNGNFTAPQFVPNPSKVTITAVANANNNVSANASATINGAPYPGSVSISPSTVTVYLTNTQIFTATVNGVNKELNWYVNSIINGSETLGTISPVPCSVGQAIYIAPLNTPGEPVTVTAQSVANPTQSATALVTLSAPQSGSPRVFITSPPVPPSVTVGQPQAFQARVAGANNTQVSWQVDGVPGGNSCLGTIAPGPKDSATYTAPLNVPNPSQVIVTAVSDAQSTSAASLPVNIFPLQPITVSISVDTCVNTSAVPISSTAQFTASVNGSANQNVTWEVNKLAGGNSTIGTISATGLYTAPAAVPSPATVTISAVSQADQQSVANQPATIVPAPVPTVKISPLQVNVDTGAGQPFVATATGLSESTVEWYVNGVPNGDPTLGSLKPGDLSECQTPAEYTAPNNVPNPNQVQVQAVSSVDPNVMGVSTVTIEQSEKYEVTVDPSQIGVIVGQTQPFTSVVTPLGNQNVTWSLSGKGCSGLSCGTITPTGVGAANYVAPPNVPNPNIVTVTATAQVDPNAKGTAQVTVEPNTSPSIAIFPSFKQFSAGSGTFDFEAQITNAPPNTEVQWQLGCISLADSGENCDDDDFDGSGPGCTQVGPNGFKVCGAKPNGGDGNLPLIYYPPSHLGSGSFQQNACTQTDDGTGWVPLSVTMNVQGCPTGGCTAQACIQITP